uniref:Leucine-rich repeat-containing N-terminal plant-type domain-containing protein n=1 Tax=Fagus sylvatica TaxID=28930 RepID=A0A2N9IYU6_FAGSY
MSASISISLVILVWTTTIITHVANNVATTVALVAESQSSWSLDQELKALNKTGWWWPRLSEESTLSPCQWRGIVCNVGGSVKEINLIDCMGNAIRFLKSRIAKLPLTLSESEAKASLQSDIEQFINEKIILADKVIVKHAVTKIRDVLVLPGVIPLSQLSPALPSRHRQKSGRLHCQEADSSPNGLAATLGSLAVSKYTSDLISRAGITDSKIVDTPIEYNNRMNTHDGEPLLDATRYKQLVRSLVYLTVTRPNISYAVYIVSQFMATLRSLHYVAILRILRGAYRPSFHYRDLGVDCSTVVLIHCDNRSAIKIAHNDVFHERTKHIEIDCHFVRHHLHYRVQLDSICSNELGDPDAISKVPGRKDINYLDGCTNSENLQLLNLM